MSKQNNLLTKYFKKDKIRGANQSLQKSNADTERSEENDEGETNSLKRLKLHENNDSTTSTSVAPTIDSTTPSVTPTIDSTPSPTSLISPACSTTSSTSLAPLTDLIVSPTSLTSPARSTTSSTSLKSPTYARTSSTCLKSPTPSTKSPNERDPCHGPATAKNFIFLGHINLI